MENPKIFVHGDSSSKDKVIGEIEDSRKKTWDSILSEDELNLLKEGEIEKDEMMMEVINISNEITNEFIKDLGLEPINVAHESIHLVNNDTYEKITGSSTSAHNNMGHRSIFIRNLNGKNRPPEIIIPEILHEIIHYKHFESQQAFDIDKGEGKIRYSGPFRSGLKVFLNIKKSEVDVGDYEDYFEGLDEAIVSEIEKRVLPRLIEKSELVPKKSFSNEIRSAISNHVNVPVEEISFVTEVGFSPFSYYNQRKVLYYVIDRIEKKYMDLSKDEILLKFFKAHFSGNILEIARLVEKTFGSGSFRVLGGMSITKESSENVLEKLMTM